jgi:predicted nucleotidyltransferase
MLDKKTVVNIAEQYTELLRKEFSPAAIVLYGSYVKGNPHKDSDIDIAIIFDGFTGNKLKTSSRLWHLRKNISLYIEPILLDSTKDKSGFVRHVYKTGQIIYKSEMV